MNLETVDLNPLFESSKKGKERPPFTAIGNLPKSYRPDSYIDAASEFFKKSQSRTLFDDLDHFMFVIWYERNSLDDNYLREFALALRGIGLHPHEQKERFDFWRLSKEDTPFIKPNENYYPKVLPLAVFEMLKCIILLENPTRKWRQNLTYISLITSLFWQSKRLNIYPKPMAMNYIGKHISNTRRGTISKHISLLEKYEIVKCIFQGNRNGRSNIYITNIADNKYKYPLIHPTYDKRYKYSPNTSPLINCGADSEYLYEDLVVSLYGNRRSIAYIEDSRQRRSNKSKKNSQKKQLWPIYDDMKILIEKKLDIMRESLSVLPVDTDYLQESINSLNHQLSIIDSSDAKLELKLKAELRLCMEMLNAKGIPHDFELTRSGRLKTSDIVNYLNTSMQPDKYGYSLWRAIKTSLWKIDIRSAEILIASILTKDKKLFEDCCQGDVYQKAADILNIEDRKSIKRLWLAIQYGQSQRNVEKEFQQIDQKLRKYIKQMYPTYYKELDRLRGLGKKIKEKNINLHLPHNEPARLEPGRGFALPALVMQSVVVCLITKFFLDVHDLNYHPIFDYHDAVLCREPISEKEANNLFRPLIYEFIERQELFWDVGNTDFVKVQKLSFNKKRVFKRRHGKKKLI